MFFNFKKNGKNLFNIKLKTISKSEHKISKDQISDLAKNVIHRLNNFGYEAYIVGGAIRDLIIGKKPKDFDVVTNATPKQIKAIFKNSRIIGKRFKLVHIYFGKNIIEVATFRRSSDKPGENSNNLYGKIEDDVVRRDFTINALYYDIETEYILDYVNGFEDLKNRRIVTLKDEVESFKEDPVRMFRAIKYSVYLGTELDKNLKKVISKYGKEIENCPSGRLYEELMKIFKTNNSYSLLKELNKYGILKYVFPEFVDSIDGYEEKIFELLNIADKKISNFYEIYWLLLFYYQIIDKLKENLSFNSILPLFKSYIKRFNIPNKISVDLSLTLFVFMKYINCDKMELSKLKSLKNPLILEYLKILLNIFNYQSETIDLINSILVKLESKITEAKIITKNNKVNKDKGTKEKVIIIKNNIKR